MKAARAAGIIAVALALGAFPLPAQIRASEIGSVSQIIDGTKISLEYSRPRMRGRAPAFGKIVRWDEVWTPGANYATTFDVNKDVRLDGHLVPKGKYSLWMVVKKDGNWTMVLDPDFHRFHMDPPDSNLKQVRFPIRAVEAPLEEVLRWQFDALEVSGATLAMHWGTTSVSMKLDVTPSLRMQTPAAEAAPFLGTWDFKWTGPDSTKKTQLLVTYKDGWMMGDFQPKDGYLRDFALIRVADNWYTMGIFSKGAVYEVIRELVIEFTRGTDGVWTLEVRDEDDKLQATGRKRP